VSRASDDLKTLEGLLEAFNGHDLDGIMAFFSEDCSACRAAVRQGLQSRFDLLPDVH